MNAWPAVRTAQGIYATSRKTRGDVRTLCLLLVLAACDPGGESPAVSNDLMLDQHRLTAFIGSMKEDEYMYVMPSDRHTPSSTVRRGVRLGNDYLGVMYEWGGDSPETTPACSGNAAEVAVCVDEGVYVGHWYQIIRQDGRYHAREVYQTH